MVLKTTLRLITGFSGLGLPGDLEKSLAVKAQLERMPQKMEGGELGHAVHIPQAVSFVEKCSGGMVQWLQRWE